MKLTETDSQNNVVRGRIVSYGFTMALLCLLFFISRDVTWQGSNELHTRMEIVATLLAFMVGIMALIRFYSKKNNYILFIGAGFIGTAVLDVYHTIVTSAFFTPYLPADLPALIPWSWVASRLFLSLLLFLSWLVWKLEDEKGKTYNIKDIYVYAMVAVLTVLCFLFFSLAPLPRLYYPEYIFGRPEEFIPGIFFLCALIGNLRKAAWKNSTFEHWLILALIVSVASQFIFMPFSFGLYDFDFDMAHLLKKATYIFVLIGLLFSMYRTFKEAEDSATKLTQTNEALAQVNLNLSLTAKKRKIAELTARKNEVRLRTIFETVSDGIITTDQTGKILAFNSGAEMEFGYRAKEVIGKNVKILMPNNFARHHDGYMTKSHEESGISAIGRRRELTGLRKDKTTFDMDLTINAVIDENGDKTITGIIRNITLQKRSVDDLKKSNEELEQFAYVASHDLKAPLRGIKNLAGFIREDGGDDLDPDTFKNFELLQNRIYRMEQLLDDLLAYSRAGRKKYSLETIELKKFIPEIVTLIAPPEGFDIQVKGVLSSIRTLRTPLQQVLMNIMGNAVKHHDETSGKIMVTVGESEKFIEFSISDDGPGILQEFQDRIFIMFQTLKPRDDIEGSGMGLAIVRKIIESIGGTIEIHSKDGIRGTKFLIFWPKQIHREEAIKND